MSEQTLFTGFWEHESKTTRNVIARIPEASDYRPDAKSRTASEIAWQIVCEEKMLIDALESGKMEWNPATAPTTMREMVDVYDVQSAEMLRRLKALPAGVVGRHARFLREGAAGSADGLGLPVRHRAPPRADHNLLAADGIDRPANLRPERGRALTVAPRGSTRSATDCYYWRFDSRQSGPVAQLGARLNGIQEVTGSIPVRSTNLTRLYTTLTVNSTLRSQRSCVCLGADRGRSDGSGR